MNKNIVIRDSKGLQKKISEFKNDGAKGFHVVADFDRTLTASGKHRSSYALIREGEYMNEEYHKKSNEYSSIYYPIEQSNKISQQVKNKKMVQWWELHYGLMVKYNFSRKIIKDVLKKDEMQLREGTYDFFDKLNENKIPILIFSAGLGDFIKEYLKLKKKLTRNVHIISNFFKFDKKGKAIGFNRPLIHTFNKNETEVKHYAYKKDVSKRKNVILMGDMLADIEMTEGIAHDSIIRIGFLNSKVKENLPKFKKEFDVVILNDGSMDYVNSIIDEIIN